MSYTFPTFERPKKEDIQGVIDLLKKAKPYLRGCEISQYYYLCHAIDAGARQEGGGKHPAHGITKLLVLNSIYPYVSIVSWLNDHGIERDYMWYTGYRQAWVDHMIEELTKCL